MVHQRKGAPWGIWPVGQAVKTPASHAGNAGSIPARVTNLHSRGDWKRGCHSAKQSQTASFAKRNSLGRSRRGRSCVTNFPHRLTSPHLTQTSEALAAFDHTAGDYDAEDPPVPIPNTEVKLSRAENTWRVAAWKHRSSPASLYSSIAQSVEHATVNRRVVGSSPTWGATIFLPNG